MKQTKNLANSKVNTQSVLAKDPINIHIWMKASEKNRTIKKENESVMGNGKSTGRFGMVETERWGKYRRMRKVKKKIAIRMAGKVTRNHIINCLQKYYNKHNSI